MPAMGYLIERFTIYSPEGIIGTNTTSKFYADLLLQYPFWVHYTLDNSYYNSKLMLLNSKDIN